MPFFVLRPAFIFPCTEPFDNAHGGSLRLGKKNPVAVNMRPANHRANRRGFTLAEVMLSMALLSIASAALLMGTSAGVQTTDESIRDMIAKGLAQQLLDEVSGKRYMEAGTTPTQWPMGPGSDEMGGPGRSPFDDIDDYDNFTAQPVKDRWNITMGTDEGDGTARDTAFQMSAGYFNRWHEQVDVDYVASSALSTPLASGSTSYYRRVRVRVFYDDPFAGTLTLADISRVFTYVPAP